MSTISELQIKIGADSSGLSTSLNQAKTDIDKTFVVNPVNEMNAAIGNLNGSVSGLIGKFNGLVGLAAGGFGLNALVEGAVNAGAGVYQMAQTLHTSTAEAAEFNRILKMTGAETHLAETAFVRLDKTFTSSSDEGEKCRNIFAAVGVSLTDSNGKLKPINQQLELLAQGYKKASDAGYGQDFVMNTLGARGMALVKTLKNYNEAKENSQKVKGIGLNPEEMYKAQQEIKLMEMQAGQLKIAMGSIFVDIFQGQGGKLSNTLGEWAKLIADNRTQIASTTVEVLKLLAAYEGMKVAAKVGTAASNFYQSMKPVASVTPVVEDNALTASQERAIAKRQALIDAAAKKEEAAYLKTVQAMEISEAEKTTIFTEYLIKREQASMESQAAIRASMTEMYLQSATAGAESAAAQAGSMNSVALAAEESAARVATANATEAESAAVVIGAEGEKAVAMTEAGVAGTRAASEVAVANAALTEAETVAGAAAVAAGEKATTAATVTTAAVGETTLANEALTVAETTAGDAGAVAGGRMAEAATVATGAVSTLTKAVWALAGGWYGVAAAIAYAMYQSSQRSNATANQVAADHVVLSDGTIVDGNGEGVYDYGDSVKDDVNSRVNTGDSYDTGGTEIVDTENAGTQDASVPQDTGTPNNTFELSDAQKEEYNNVRYQQWYKSSDPEAIAERARQAQSESDEEIAAREAALRAQQDALLAALQDTGKKDKKGKGEHEEKPKTHEIQVAVGELASTIAANHTEGEQWMGNITNDPSIQCDSFTANVYAQAGIGSIGGVDTSNSTINDSAFRAANAYHDVGDGYVPQNGDLVNFDHHVGIYDNGNVVSRQSSAGVHTASMTEAQGYFGPVRGYGSVAEATGGMTVTQTVDEAGKKIEDAAAKLAKAKEEAYKLFQSMSNTLLSETGTAYQQGMNKLSQDIAAKQQQISKLANAGVDTTALSKELDIYKKTLEEKIVKTWHDAWYKVKDDTRKTMDEMTGDYEDEARMQYDTTVRALNDERKERLKSIQQSENDYAAKLAVDKWYNGEVLKAADDRDKALKESHDKMIKQWADQGEYNKILLNLNNHPQQRQKDIDLDGEKKLASEVVKIWDAAHQSIDADIAEGADALYGSLTDSVEGFIQRTKSAMDIVHSFGNTILSEISRIAAQKFAGQVIGGLFGNVLGGSSGSGGYGISPISSMSLPAAIDSGSGSYGISSSAASYTLGDLPVPHFANGGIVSAPTLGLIGEAGVTEAVVPLNNDNLSAIGGNKGATGGIVVNITNNSDAQPKVVNQHYDAGLNRMVLDMVIDGAQRNVGGFSNNLKTALGG